MPPATSPSPFHSARPRRSSGPDRHGGDVPHPHRGPGEAGAYRHVADVLERLDVPEPAHHELGLGQLDEAAADIVVAAPDRGPDLLQGNPVGHQLVGVDGHLVLLDEAADARHLGDPGHAGQLVAQVPVLDRAQLREVAAAAGVDEGVLVHPANPGRVRTQPRPHPGRQPVAGVIEVFQHPAARPVHVGAVLEDDVDEGEPEEGVPPHRPGERHRQHRRAQRKGHLVLDHLGGLPRVLGEDDHLHVRQVGDGVEGGVGHGVEPGAGRKQGQQQGQQLVADAGFDDAPYHDEPSRMEPTAAFRLLSESIRNCAEVTIRSPSRRPSSTS